MNEVVERVARALCRRRYVACFEDAERIDEIVERRWPGYADDARSAIAAMREPSEAMKRAGGTCYVATDLWYPAPEEAGECWRAMIDAALKD